MDFYKNNSVAKSSLGILGVIIIITTMIYSQYLARQLKAREEATMDLVTEAIGILANQKNASQDNTIMESLILEEFNGLLPTIMEDESGNLVGYNYWKETLNTDEDFLERRKQRLLEKGFEPIKGYGNSHFIYYEHSRLYTLISLFPIAQILLISTFIILGYIMLAASRRAEQNRIWAGMAKETAHQLGTPTSAILGWIEHLKEISTDRPEYTEVISELKNDVDRLDLIADRFSKIGSSPDLKRVNLVEELAECKNYMEKRASKRVVFDFPPTDAQPVYCSINSHLFDWVIENMLRNALDAMQGVGHITATLEKHGNMAHLNITDDGRGIPSGDFKNIFRPGFTTKKRGWGLGLSLAKRIIENYHKGKIYVKSSKPNEGTKFTIELPIA